MNEAQITYNLLPKQIEFVNATEKETLAVGAWGSAKSTSLCFAILKEATIPNSQILLCRKTYTALRRTTFQTLLYGAKPIIPVGAYVYNKVEQTIKLNGLGSTIYLAGLDNMEKIRSMNLSMVAVDEASELNESEWIELIGRLRSQYGSRRIIAATNPATPSHFLYQRFYINKNNNRKCIQSTTLDNIYLPKDYIDSLNDLPKAMYDRYVLGEWKELEKAIYPQFKRETHLKVRGWGEFGRYVLGVDFGFTNPCALVLCGVDGDDNIHIIDEEKKKGMLIGDIVELAENKYGKFQPLVIVDPSAPALIAEFEKAGFNVKKADNSVDSGIARMQNWLAKGKLSSNPDNIEWIKEIENYCYDDDGKPTKINDHLCFIEGTKVLTEQGYKNIEEIKKGDSVFDGNMYNRVSDSNNTGKKEVSLYKINDKYLICTDDHPIFINGIKIGIGELCRLFNEIQKKELLKKLNLKEESIDDIFITSIKNTSLVGMIESEVDQEHYIGTYGLNIMDQYLKDFQYIIRISTTQIIILKILNLLTRKNICRFIPKSIIKSILNLLEITFNRTKINVDLGINQKKVTNGIEYTQEKCLEIEQPSQPNAQNAEYYSNTIYSVQNSVLIHSAPTIVKANLDETLEKIILNLYAIYAEELIQKTNIQKLKLVQENVQDYIEAERLNYINRTSLRSLPVFNLTVENSHRYFANNILVSNCDATRYALCEVVSENVKPSSAIVLFGGNDDDEF